MQTTVVAASESVKKGKADGILGTASDGLKSYQANTALIPLMWNLPLEFEVTVPPTNGN